MEMMDAATVRPRRAINDLNIELSTSLWLYLVFLIASRVCLFVVHYLTPLPAKIVTICHCLSSPLGILAPIWGFLAARRAYRSLRHCLPSQDQSNENQLLRGTALTETTHMKHYQDVGQQTDPISTLSLASQESPSMKEDVAECDHASTISEAVDNESIAMGFDEPANLFDVDNQSSLHRLTDVCSSQPSPITRSPSPQNDTPQEEDPILSPILPSPYDSAENHLLYTAPRQTYDTAKKVAVGRDMLEPESQYDGPAADSKIFLENISMDLKLFLGLRPRCEDRLDINDIDLNLIVPGGEKNAAVQEQWIQPLVNTVLKKQKSLCIFADGESGSGKSYTFFEDENSTAVHSLQSLYRIAAAVEPCPKEVYLGLAMSEFTGSNEVADLLASVDRKPDCLELILGREGKKATDADNIVLCKGERAYRLKCSTLVSDTEHRNLFKDITWMAARSRRKQPTDLNSTSSRGHALLRMWAIQEASDGGSIPPSMYRSQLTIIDLAGNEESMKTKPPGYEKESNWRYIRESRSDLTTAIQNWTESGAHARYPTMPMLLKILTQDFKVLWLGFTGEDPDTNGNKATLKQMRILSNKRSDVK